MRTQALEQLPNGISAKRETIEPFLAQEEQLGGLLTTVRETATEANTLATSVQGLAETLDLGGECDSPADAKPFEIAAYASTLAEAGVTIRELNILAESTNSMAPE